MIKFTVKSSLKGKILNGLLLWKMLKVMGDAYGIDLSNIEKSAKVERALWYLLSNELRGIKLSFDGKGGEEERNLAQNELSVSLTEWAKERADQRKLILEEDGRIESLIEEQMNKKMEEDARIESLIEEEINKKMEEEAKIEALIDADIEKQNVEEMKVASTIAMMEEQARREHEKEDIFLASMLHQDCEEIWKQEDVCYERLIELQLQKDQLKFSEDQSKLDEILKEESALKAKLAGLRKERRALLGLDI